MKSFQGLFAQALYLAAMPLENNALQQAEPNEVPATTGECTKETTQTT
ncbi:hypothetical protein [Shewanella youngdeokensis]|uniref:Uncharacterized protein n=1 Tax=Shewanella youngdeokensis TaxID=2999068 RepID=A0ABZ0JZD6_9GAMM|nr:hypothetical protein RGE70_01870 [Shewanella sp. DAU334]